VFGNDFSWRELGRVGAEADGSDVEEDSRDGDDDEWNLTDVLGISAAGVYAQVFGLTNPQGLWCHFNAAVCALLGIAPVSYCVANWRDDGKTSATENPVVALQAILSEWSMAGVAVDGGDLRSAVEPKAPRGFFAAFRDPLESVCLLFKTLATVLGCDFADLFRIGTAKDASGAEGAKRSDTFWRVYHQQIGAFFRDAEGLMVNRARGSLEEVWPALFTVAFEPEDELAVSAGISVPADFAVETRDGVRCEYHLVSHVRRLGANFGGHATARVRAALGSDRWRFYDDASEVRLVKAGKSRPRDSACVGFFLCSDYWAHV
jgi:hypothetical protein